MRQKKYIAQYLDFIGKPLPVIARGVDQLLYEKKTEIVKKLEKAYEEKFPFDEITVYIHSCLFSPYNYNEKWFMSSKNNGEDGHITTALHELNHFMFYYYYPELKDELGKEKFESLKEALTVFTNPEEKGYPAQQKLRAWLASQKKSIPEIIKDNEWRYYL